MSPSNDIVATYEVELLSTNTQKLEAAAQNLVAGMTTGTMQSAVGSGNEMSACDFGPLGTAHRGEVLSVIKTGDSSGEITVKFSRNIAQTASTGFAGLLTVVLGDILGIAYGFKAIKLIALDIPEEVTNDFPGPRFGTAGIRERLAKPSPETPLAGILLKPNTGQPTSYYVELATSAAKAGFDYIKEDELQFSHPECPLEERVKLISKELSDIRERSGSRIIYAPNITARSQKLMIENSLRCVEIGAGAVMINALQTGLDSLAALAEADIGVPIHAHRSGHDHYTRGNIGVDITILTRMMRLAGADLVHVGPAFGSLYKPSVVRRNVLSLMDSWHGVNNSLAILSRSARTIVQDTVGYFALDERIRHPANVMFLVDKDIYDYRPLSGDAIIRWMGGFVESVRSVELKFAGPETDRVRDH